jgi:RimJ/RimL family protein N-acetyltransferase
MSHRTLRPDAGRRHMQPLGALLPAVVRGTAVRLLQESDIERFHAYRSDAVLATYQGWSPMNIRSAQRFIEDGGQRRVSVTDARNAKSIRVLERVGFARSDAQQAVFKGEPCTELVYVYNASWRLTLPSSGCLQ